MTNTTTPPASPQQRAIVGALAAAGDWLHGTDLTIWAEVVSVGCLKAQIMQLRAAGYAIDSRKPPRAGYCLAPGIAVPDAWRPTTSLLDCARARFDQLDRISRQRALTQPEQRMLRRTIRLIDGAAG